MLWWVKLRFRGESNPLAVAKNYSLYRASKSNLPMKNATRFLPSSKYRRLPFTKKFGSRMEHKRFDGLKQMQKFTYRIEVKPVDQHLESLNSEVIHFLLCAAF